MPSRQPCRKSPDGVRKLAGSQSDTGAIRRDETFNVQRTTSNVQGRKGAVASQVPAAPFAQITNGLVGKSVQLSGGHVPLELLVPCGGGELGEPVAESQKLLAGKLADGSFDLLHGVYFWRIIHAVFRASPEAVNHSTSQPSKK
jgi:hypothetical protein